MTIKKAILLILIFLTCIRCIVIGARMRNQHNLNVCNIELNVDDTTWEYMEDTLGEGCLNKLKDIKIKEE